MVRTRFKNVAIVVLPLIFKTEKYFTMTREQFISDLSHWNSYLPLLWEALQNTEGTVIELGVGIGSTKKLHDYCIGKGRLLYSYESDIKFFKEYIHLDHYLHGLTYVGNNWQIMQEKHVHGKTIGVLFSDEAPGEMRKYNISMFCNIAQVIVAHDTEPSSDHGYKLSLVEPLFKYIKRFEYPGAHATAYSNFIDVTKWEV